MYKFLEKYNLLDSPHGSVVKNPPDNAGDTCATTTRKHSRARKPQRLSLCASTTEASTP